MSNELKDSITDYLATNWGFVFNSERKFYENKTHTVIFSAEGENIYLTSKISDRCTSWNIERSENVFDCIDRAISWN